MKTVLVSIGLMGVIILAYYQYGSAVKIPTQSTQKEITLAELTALQNNLDHRNQVKDYPTYPSNYDPVVVGTYKDMIVEEQYWCSDLCPDNGFLYLTYASTTEASCDSLGGHKLYKYGWGFQYVGCSPIENNSSD